VNLFFRSEGLDLENRIADPPCVPSWTAIIVVYFADCVSAWQPVNVVAEAD
jgi:hypothetical protein